MELNQLKGKKILLILQRDWCMRHGFEIAKKLKEYKAELSTLVFKKEIERFIEVQKEIKFSYILKNSDVDKNHIKINQESGYNVKMLLDDYKINSIWENAFTLREKSISFNKYPFSYEQNADDKSIESYIVAFAFRIKELINNFSPDLIIGYNLGDLRHLLILKKANINKIPFFFMSDTKVQNIGAFYYDLNCEKSFFKNREKKLNEKKIKSANREKAKKYILEYRLTGDKIPHSIKNINLDKSLINIPDEISFLKKIFRYLRYDEIDYDNPSIKNTIRNYIFQKISINKNRKIKYDRIDQIKNFVFFPLQHYPETQLGMLNSVHDNQLNVAKVLARFLPDNLTLVVKNHPYNYERRTPSLLNKFRNTPNVKLIDHKIPNYILYKKMHSLVSMCGTSIFEAAILKKPAIQIGSLKMMTSLPNFFFLDKLENITSIINSININFPKIIKSQEYDEKLINYISAAFDVGFDFELYEQDFRKDRNAFEYIWKIYFKEINKVFKLKKYFSFD
jgi:hypothetical protein